MSECATGVAPVFVNFASIFLYHQYHQCQEYDQYNQYHQCHQYHHYYHYHQCNQYRECYQYHQYYQYGITSITSITSTTRTTSITSTFSSNLVHDVLSIRCVVSCGRRCNKGPNLRVRQNDGSWLEFNRIDSVEKVYKILRDYLGADVSSKSARCPARISPTSS